MLVTLAKSTANQYLHEWLGNSFIVLRKKICSNCIIDLIFFLLFAYFTESNYGGKIPIVCFAQGGGKETLKVSSFLLFISRSDNRGIALTVKTDCSKRNLMKQRVLLFTEACLALAAGGPCLQFKLLKVVSVKISLQRFCLGLTSWKSIGWNSSVVSVLPHQNVKGH